MSGLKSFQISKHMVYEAYLKVKANKGAAGVNGRWESAAVRAGSQREPVQAVEPDVVGLLFSAAGADGGDPQAGRQGGRVFGVPSVADRIAQTVAAMALEPEVEKIFHPDSYGYRPRKSALDAVGACRERCWRTDWVIDLDIKGFFDNLDHDLVLKAVAHHTDQRWILLYVRRWLKAPLQRPGRRPGCQGSRQPAGLGDLTVARQPVHALCVRCLDGPGFPACPLRAVLR